MGRRRRRLSTWTTPFGNLAIPGKETRDPWLCVPPLRMVCLCRGTEESRLLHKSDCQRREMKDMTRRCQGDGMPGRMSINDRKAVGAVLQLQVNKSTYLKLQSIREMSNNE